MKKKHLPKQLKHWLKLCNIKTKRNSHFYFHNKNRYFRIFENETLDGFVFDISEKFEKFDRWANSSEKRIEFKFDSLNEKVFCKTVKEILKKIK